MSGLVIAADLCAAWATQVKAGWRGRWPCTGEQTMLSGPPARPIGLVECSCRCHAGEFEHELPARANRTAVHPTDVLADDPDARKFWGGGG